MRRLMVTTAVLTVLAHLGSPVLEACGAKFLVATRAASYQRLQFASQPANILVYQHTDDAGVAEFAVKLQGMLEDVGHTVTIVAGEDGLRDAARTQDFNIVMMELEVARRLRADLGSWSPDSTILPMVEFATRAEASRAKREFGQVLKLPAKDITMLSAVQKAYAATS